MFEHAERETGLQGEMILGPTRLAEENARKNKFYGMFHPNMESVGGHVGDRNKMGDRGMERKVERNYE